MINDITILSKIFAAYAVFTLFFPYIMMKAYLRRETVIRKLMICFTIGNMLVINVVFVLAFLKIYYAATFYLVYFLCIITVRYLSDKKKINEDYRKAKVTGTQLQEHVLGTKILIRRIKRYVIRNRIRIPVLGLAEFIAVLLLLLFHIFIFSHRTLTYVSFSAPDEEVHLQWIQSLLNNNIYHSGMYPFGFHNVVSSVITITGIASVSVVRFFGVVQSTFFILFEYLCLKTIFKNRYAPLLGLIIVSMTSLLNQEAVSRFQFPVPQEFGAIFIFIMFVFLVNYIRTQRKFDLFLFGTSFALTLAIHYYDTILALLLCFCTGIVFLFPIFKKKLFAKLLLCGILSTMFAVWPIALGGILGYPFEQSMNWAVSVMKNEDNLRWEDDTPEEILEKKQRKHKKTPEETLIDHAFTNREGIIFVLTLMGAGFLLYAIQLIFRKSRSKMAEPLPIYLFSAIIFIMMAAEELGLPVILYPTRLPAYLHFSVLFIVSMPLEAFYLLFAAWKAGRGFAAIVSAAAIAAVFPAVGKEQYKRTFPVSYYYQTKGTSQAVTRIINTYPENTWTIVSCVTETSIIYRDGFHYEWIDFIDEIESQKERIIIPTKYVFFVIEKMPIVKFGVYFEPGAKEFDSRPLLKEEDYLKELKKEKDREDYYKNQRDVVMAKAYHWVKLLEQNFPNETDLYYEDKEVAVYRFRQNEAYDNLSMEADKR